MKVISPQEMARIEALAYAAGASEVDFMENAGTGVASWVQNYVEHTNSNRHVILLCGKGNNAGDAYVAGRHLIQAKYTVDALTTDAVESFSPLCRRQHDAFLAAGGKVQQIKEGEPIELPPAILVDGIFGTGFHGAAEGVYAALILAANASRLPIIAIDIPSGLDGATGDARGPVIKAVETLFLSFPKTGFFLLKGWNHTGKLRYVDIGLSPTVFEQAQADLTIPPLYDMSLRMPAIQRDRHKYQAGYVVGLAGSPDMPGAAILASTAALRGGAGIVRLLSTEIAMEEMAQLPPEVLRTTYTLDALTTALQTLNSASATFVGPGIGRTSLAETVMESLVPVLTKPCVIDADALNLMAEKSLAFPKQCILTPHHGEMGRLLQLGTTPLSNMELLQQTQRYAEEHKVTIVLKGAPSFVIHPGKAPSVVVWGDPGMATAGAGDVLTGLLASLLAQGLDPYNAALLGTFLHGRAGQIAAENLTSYCMIASDITEALPYAFAELI